MCVREEGEGVLNAAGTLIDNWKKKNRMLTCVFFALFFFYFVDPKVRDAKNAELFFKTNFAQRRFRVFKERIVLRRIIF